MFSYLSPEERVPRLHPLRAIREMADRALKELSPQFDALYAKTERPSIAPEKLLRALLLQVLYSVRSERMLMEQLNYNLLFRWFVGLNMDDGSGRVTVAGDKGYDTRDFLESGVAFDLQHHRVSRFKAVNDFLKVG